MIQYNIHNVNQQNYSLCPQRRLRSALASAMSDQSLCCPHEGQIYYIILINGNFF